jgi:hypothetical protein
MKNEIMLIICRYSDNEVESADNVKIFFFTRARQLMPRKHRSLKAYCAP